MQKSNSSSILRDINKHKHIWHWYIYATSSICIPNTSIIDIPVIYIWVNKGRSRKLLRKRFSWLSYVYIYIYIYIHNMYIVCPYDIHIYIITFYSFCCTEFPSFLSEPAHFSSSGSLKILNYSKLSQIKTHYL